MPHVRYSVVLPSLNGAETLPRVLSSLCAIDRDDVEFVVSDNLSDDATWDVIHTFDDPRVVAVQPTRRLTIGEHLDFAYSNSRGEWVGHIGDEDTVFAARFDLLDAVISATSAGVVRGRISRYIWDDFHDAAQANLVNAAEYTGELLVVPGPLCAEWFINQCEFYHGGTWQVHRSVYDRVRERFGCFSTPEHVEFFAMRAACALAERVALVDSPFVVIGRHDKSSGAQALAPKEQTTRDDWDWDFELPRDWAHSPFQVKGYSGISLDAALKIRSGLPDVLGHVDLDWPNWCVSNRAFIEQMVAFGQLPPRMREHYEAALGEIQRKCRAGDDPLYRGNRLMGGERVSVLATARPEIVRAALLELSLEADPLVARADYDASSLPNVREVVRYPAGMLTEAVLGNGTARGRLTACAGQACLVVLGNEDGGGYSGVLGFASAVGFSEVWTRSVSGHYACVTAPRTGYPQVRAAALYSPRRAAVDFGWRTDVPGALIGVREIGDLAGVLDHVVRQLSVSVAAGEPLSPADGRAST